jgi:hypothetical protein
MSSKTVHSEDSCPIVVKKILSKKYFVLNCFGNLFLLLSLFTSTCIHALGKYILPFVNHLNYVYINIIFNQILFYYIVPQNNKYTKNNNFSYSLLSSSMNYSQCMSGCSTFSTNGSQPITIYLNGDKTMYPSMTTWISYALCSPNAVDSYCNSSDPKNPRGSWGDASNNAYNLSSQSYRTLFSNFNMFNSAKPNVLYNPQPLQLSYSSEDDIASCYCKLRGKLTILFVSFIFMF